MGLRLSTRRCCGGAPGTVADRAPDALDHYCNGGKFIPVAVVGAGVAEPVDANNDRQLLYVDVTTGAR